MTINEETTNEENKERERLCSEEEKRMVNRKRHAVLVGCTYKGVMHGSSKNVDWMFQTLVNRFYFKEENITVLKEHAGGQQPTHENITNAIAHCIATAGNRDVIFFYFSGGGTTSRVSNNQVNQCIVTSDLQIINDQYFTHEVLPKLPYDASFTMVVDASYSGQLMDKPQQQTPQQQPPAAGRIGILLSACDKDELAYEYGTDGNVYGAFTYALKLVLDKHPTRITNRELIHEAKITVASKGFPSQHPCLYCDQISTDAYFLFQFEE